MKRSQDICKHVKIEGAGCSRNTSCEYPNCVINQLQEQLEKTKELNRKHVKALKTISFKQIPQSVINIVLKELNRY